MENVTTDSRTFWSARRLTATALLTAIGILIPMVMPKIWIGPASYTLASHVAIFIAMMLSPAIAATVAVGTVLGFWISGLPPVIAFRAASHLIFAMIGSFYLQKRPETLASPMKVHIFSFLIAVLHSLCEVVVIFFLGGLPEEGFLYALISFGIGFVAHSLIDFEIALGIFKVLSKQRGFAALSRR
jgi:niacin transporter